MGARFFTIAIAMALTTTALAADLPSSRAPEVLVPPPPVYAWDGFYVGGQVGYAFGRDRATIDTTGVPRIRSAVVPYGQSPSGIIGGAHVGYNFAVPSIGFGSGLILGLEGDIDGLGYRKTVDFGPSAGAAPGLAFNSIRSDIQGSARGRIGVAFDKVLFYATGGAAFGEFKTFYNTTAANPAFVPQGFTHGRVGYTIGGGVEYAITPLWSLRADYRYSDFGRYADITTTTFAVPNIPVYHRETIQRVQAGFSFKLSPPPAAVVAKY